MYLSPFLRDLREERKKENADSATAEEIKDASLILPRSIMASLFLNGALGFIMLVTYCFCLGNVEEILGTPTGYPFIQVFYNVTNSHGGASAMTAILISLTVCGCISNVATASRQLFAFARDGGLPFSPFLAHVNSPHASLAAQVHSRLIITDAGQTRVEYSP